MKDITIKACVGIASITCMEIAALIMGHDGVLLAAASAAVAALATGTAVYTATKLKK
jgi:hypothetical protein